MKLKKRKQEKRFLCLRMTRQCRYTNSVDYYEPSLASALDITDFEVYDDQPNTQH